jgi:predicted dehydrogenase
MEKPITAVLVGAGNRGMLYGRYARKNPGKLTFSAVAEPIETRLRKFSRRHGISRRLQFRTWKELLSREKLADAVLICTQDQMHTEPALQALDRGYHVLLEKPMATTLDECLRIVRKAREMGRFLAICHVLRYTDFFTTVYDAVHRGLLGRVVSVQHAENIAWYHFSHSYVRGEWANRTISSPVILAKCCHDLDLLYWLIGSPPSRISSFGSLLHFREENAPDGGPAYCVEGCPIDNSCLYYAPRLYIDIVPIEQIACKSDNRLFRVVMNCRQRHTGLFTFAAKVIIPPLRYIRYWRWWPVSYLYTGQREDYSDEGKWDILRTSPYGRCVFRASNDVVDHQVVAIEFANGVTAHLTMHGFSEREGRTVRIDGTRASLIGEFNLTGERIRLFDHYTGRESLLHKKKLRARGIPHGGGDFRLVDSFVENLRSDRRPMTSGLESLESHLMAFAADTSRLEGRVVDMATFRRDRGVPGVSESIDTSSGTTR